MESSSKLSLSSEVPLRKLSIPSENVSIPKLIVTKDTSSGQPEQPVLIRKTSIRRRVSKDEQQKPPEIRYGNLTEEYDSIRDRMMADKGVQNTIEALEERWRMIMYMYDDCVSMFENKLSKDRLQRRVQQKQELIATALIYGSLSVPFFFMILIAYLFVIFF